MKKIRKAYLVEESHNGMGLRVSPVLVADHVPGEAYARVFFINVVPGRAWIPSLTRDPLAVRVENLASTRTRALAKIALRLQDLETQLTAHFAVTAPSPVAPPAENPPSPSLAGAGVATPGGRRRSSEPWYRRD